MGRRYLQMSCLSNVLILPLISWGIWLQGRSTAHLYQCSLREVMNCEYLLGFTNIFVCFILCKLFFYWSRRYIQKHARLCEHTLNDFFQAKYTHVTNQHPEQESENYHNPKYLLCPFLVHNHPSRVTSVMIFKAID